MDGSTQPGHAFACALAVVAGATLASVAWSHRPPPDPPAALLREAERARTELRPDRMGVRDLRRLPGIGARRAEDVLDLRRRSANEGRAESLTWTDVRGIGPRTSAGVRGWIAARGGDPDRPLWSPAPSPLAPGAGGATLGAMGPGSPLARAALLVASLALAAGCTGEPVGIGSEAGPGVRGGADHQEESVSRPIAIEELWLELDGVLPPGTEAVRLILHALAAGGPGTKGEEGILLLHGARFTSQTWRELGTIEHLAALGHRVLALDLPGHGRSAALPAGLEPDSGALLAEALRAAGLRRVVAVAPSMSGCWLAPLLDAHPDRLLGVVPVAPACAEAFRLPGGPRDLPALVLWGERDAVFEVSGASDLAACFADARVEILAGASHPCYLDAPAAFHEHLSAFVGRVLGR